MNKTTRKKVAVLFGGRSPEHDVSIVTGLQALNALDPALYDAFPVYVTVEGQWVCGDRLRDRTFYLPKADGLRECTLVTLPSTFGRQPALLESATSLFRRQRAIEFDVALLAFHGMYGEDGRLQGLLELAGVPYTGMRPLASAVLMDKIATKQMLTQTGIPLLPYWRINKPSVGLLLTPEELSGSFPDVHFPCCIKPVHLGSSIGVARVNNWEEVSEVLPGIFKTDPEAMLEPFVANLAEYNIAVRMQGAQPVSSAIEQPKHAAELLDFKSKYLAGGNKAQGTKVAGGTSQGMLSLTRILNPRLADEAERNIRAWAIEAFMRVGGTGAPRIDFLCDRQSGQMWLNEVNPCPGSFAYFLWEAAHPPRSFPDLLDALIAEAFDQHRHTNIVGDPTPPDARLFPR